MSLPIRFISASSCLIKIQGGSVASMRHHII